MLFDLTWQFSYNRGMEDLTKNQLVLLTLLVSFVTSIATGIITFSLLQEAPPLVTQTINRVVEKTIETVVSEGSGKNTVEVREVTVVVKEEDQVIDTVVKNSSSIVRIRDIANNFYGIGTILSPGGLVVTPTRDSFNERGRYTATLFDKTDFVLDYLGQDEKRSVVFFKIVPKDGTSFSGTPVTVGNLELKLGQSVITLEGQENNTISIGRMSSFLYSDQADPTTQYGFETDIIHKSSVVGSPLFNLSGELVGMRSGRTTPSNSPIYLPVSLLKSAITDYLAR